MVKQSDGTATCREHGGTYLGDLGALDHLEHEHPELFAMLSGGRVWRVSDDDEAAQIMREPNRATRRRRRK